MVGSGLDLVVIMYWLLRSESFATLNGRLEFVLLSTLRTPPVIVIGQSGVRPPSAILLVLVVAGLLPVCLEVFVRS